MDISLKPPVLFEILGFSITNGFLVTIIVSVILVAITLYTRYTLKTVPSGLQFWVEVFLQEGKKFMTSITGDPERTKKFFPFVMTLFLLFLFANFLSFIPGLAALTYNNMPVYRTATSDYSLIFTLTVLSMLIVQLIAIKSGGVFTYLAKFFTFKGKGFERLINFFLGIMDIISELAKVVSLSFRLFGNMFAAEVLAIVILGLIPWIVPLPFRLLGVLTSFIQAAVFAILVLIFMNMAVIEKE